MGQPTSGITQRVGRAQVWQHTPSMISSEKGFGEHIYRLTLAAKLSVLFFQSLVIPGTSQLWYRRQRWPRLYQDNTWSRYWRNFPNLFWYRKRVYRRYFEQAAPRFLLYDGEHTYMTLAYKHKRLRFASFFWAQPRFFRINSHLMLSLRGYNVTQPNQRLPRLRSTARRTGFSFLYAKKKLRKKTLNWF